ncbi:uncharacterized protein PHALS_13644 [Plasmopara halstedii]|uniref:Uncharacterized protein n=1 Tax=Plasmopara halstedii TaxID=4781 RepID=A0A0P1AQB5_PLAHL|nr:uncharacterized protein PHALS_13644 [Plasmopara halstedii]CEG43449.1 hypothetical protein PHALS_13644 [Plasmopara halstedii]|eukprot:XP_024579818.1 hypothetical protein PHALS_13644 [Plasmopara halstedii]
MISIHLYLARLQVNIAARVDTRELKAQHEDECVLVAEIPQPDPAANYTRTDVL